MLILPLILLTDTLLFSPIATILFNCYKSNVPLFTDNNPLSSDEGTTQGAMAISLIKNLKEFTVQQVWYADDAATLGKHQLLRYWWNRLSSDGPLYGYFVNPSKSWLLVKPESSLMLLIPSIKTPIIILLQKVKNTWGALLVLINSPPVFFQNSI